MIDELDDAHADLVTQWCIDRSGRPDNRGRWKLRAEVAEAEVERLLEVLKALEDAYRDVEMAMPPEQGKAAVLAWMKARAVLEAKPAVTDKMVERAIDAWNDAAIYSTIELKLRYVLSAVLEAKP